MDRDFELGGRKFKLNKLDAFKQFHIMRKLAPILTDLIPMATKLSKLGENDPGQLEALTPIMDGVAKLSDKDSEFILLGLCSAVEVQQQAGNWAFVARGDLLMMQDLNLMLLFQIAIKAFMFNMQDFFQLLPQASPGLK